MFVLILLALWPGRLEAGENLLTLILNSDLGDKSTFIQAVVASVLVWVTYQSIDRSDMQIEVAQKALAQSSAQLEVSRKQLDKLIEDSKASLIPSVITSIIPESGEYYYHIINLSQKPIYLTSVYIKSIVEGQEKYDGRSIEKKILHIGEEFSFVIMDSGGRRRINELCKSKSIEGGIINPRREFTTYSVEIEYRYAGDPGRLFKDEYRILVEYFPQDDDWGISDALVSEGEPQV